MSSAFTIAPVANGVIGKDNDLVWTLPRHEIFHENDQGHVVIPAKELRNIPEISVRRTANVVVTRNKDYEAPGRWWFIRSRWFGKKARGQSVLSSGGHLPRCVGAWRG